MTAPSPLPSPPFPPKDGSAFFVADRGRGKGEGSNLKRLLAIFHLACRYQFPKPKCLATALAKQAWLRRHGYASEVRIGVQKKGNALKAHAWCEMPKERAGRQGGKKGFFEMEPLQP